MIKRTTSFALQHAEFLVLRLLFSLFAAVCATALLAGPTAAQTEKKISIVEEILTRAVIERGAFLACAHLDQSKQTADLLVKGWKLDLADVASVLRVGGYSDAEIDTLIDRMDIKKAAPKFADLAALAAYCNVLGDWRTRWRHLQITLPQVELRRLLKP